VAESSLPPRPSFDANEWFRQAKAELRGSALDAMLNVEEAAELRRCLRKMALERRRAEAESRNVVLG